MDQDCNKPSLIPRFLLISLAFFVGTYGISFGEESTEAGQWVEWHVTFPPPDIDDATQGKPVEVRCRIRVQSVANGIATLSIRIGAPHDSKGLSVEVTQSGVDIVALRKSRILSVNKPGVKTENGRMLVFTGKLIVEKRKWVVGKDVTVERWDCRTLHFGPAYFKAGGMIIRVVGAGDRATEEPDFPYPEAISKLLNQEQEQEKDETSEKKARDGS